MKIGSLVRFMTDRDYEPYGLKDFDEEKNFGIITKFIDVKLSIEGQVSRYAMVYWIFEYQTTPHMACNLELVD